MKISDKIITTLLLLAIFVGGGYYIYTHYLPTNQGVSLENIEVETERLTEYDIFNAHPGNDTDAEFYILDTMANAEANYFKVIPIQYEWDAECHYYQVWQTDKAGFEEYDSQGMKSKAGIKAINCASRNFKKLFNYSYEKVREEGPKNPDMYQSAVIEDCFVNDSIRNIEGKFDYYFGGNIDKYFLDKKLKLSCESVEFTKIGASHWNGIFGGLFDAHYYLIGKADVTTVAAEGDVSSGGLLAPVGESTSITIRLLVSATKGSGVFYKVMYMW